MDITGYAWHAGQSETKKKRGKRRGAFFFFLAPKEAAISLTDLSMQTKGRRCRTAALPDSESLYA